MIENLQELLKDAIRVRQDQLYEQLTLEGRLSSLSRSRNLLSRQIEYFEEKISRGVIELEVPNEDWIRIVEAS
ncbi:hypothetical protein LCGC14_2561490 [marine sediment metagenome]|uniref:Uncharacterized protein n=1 Tax=marine sediment metagenome TaxID=412755 RepID=A0A0F9AKH6_9ZZZZ